LGDYPELGKRAAESIPGARLTEFPELGHAPQIQDSAAFNKALLEGLATLNEGAREHSDLGGDSHFRRFERIVLFKTVDMTREKAGAFVH
jgi:hypothetical protein